MATLEIRNITQNEKDEILKLARLLVENYEDRNSMNYNQIMDNLRNGINERIIDFKSIWYDRELAGYFHLGLKNDSVIEMYFLYVYDDFRKKGVGSHVIEHAIYQAVAKQRKLQIEINRKNKIGTRFLSDMGFKEVSQPNSETIIFEVNPLGMRR